MDRGTVSAHFVSAAVARLTAPVRERVLRVAGVPEEVLASPHARVTAEAFSALWLAVARELDDEFFGLDTRRMKVGSFALLCHAVVSAENLDHRHCSAGRLSRDERVPPGFQKVEWRPAG